MRNIEKKVWLGLLSMVGLIAPFSNYANALDNNLLTKQSLEVAPAPQGAFLVSKDKVLKKYENAHKLTDEQLVELLKAIGFKGVGLRSACAIAKAESNGRPFAFNGNEETGDSSYGVFQINMVGELGPDRRDKFDLTSNVELFNPVTNSKITFHMTKGGKDWSAWSSVNGPRYLEWYSKYPCKS
jgi:hypothetical protein